MGALYAIQLVNGSSLSSGSWGPHIASNKKLIENYIQDLCLAKYCHIPAGTMHCYQGKLSLAILLQTGTICTSYGHTYSQQRNEMQTAQQDLCLVVSSLSYVHQLIITRIIFSITKVITDKGVLFLFQLQVTLAPHSMCLRLGIYNSAYIALYLAYTFNKQAPYVAPSQRLRSFARQFRRASTHGQTLPAPCPLWSTQPLPLFLLLHCVSKKFPPLNQGV